MIDVDLYTQGMPKAVLLGLTANPLVLWGMFNIGHPITWRHRTAQWIGVITLLVFIYAMLYFAFPKTWGWPT